MYNFGPAITSTNATFNFLKGSNEFLNLVLDNVNCSVLLLNNRMELIAFNDVVKNMFPASRTKRLQYTKCGEVLGCAYQIGEGEECGKTAHCKTCELRLSAINSYLDGASITRKKIVKPFYINDFIKMDKTLVYSIRTFVFQGEKYLLLTISDNC